MQHGASANFLFTSTMLRLISINCTSTIQPVQPCGVHLLATSPATSPSAMNSPAAYGVGTATRSAQHRRMRTGVAQVPTTDGTTILRTAVQSDCQAAVVGGSVGSEVKVDQLTF